VLQGAFVLAKAKDSTQVAIDSIDHLRRYIQLLFKKEKRQTKE
jgi:TetR/AcrR family transcriptional repressor of nem operon